jgi:hypothetical protein
MLKRTLTAAGVAVAMAFVWVLSRFDDGRLYDEMEDEDPEESQPWETEEPNDDE